MTNSADFFRRLSLRVGALAALGLFLLAFSHGDTLAAEAKRNVKFDHVKTGFPLTGAHVTLPCETCHVQGTFKGTPKKCETCHTPGSRVQSATVKPSNHIPTNQACSQCHSSTASWKVARFTHVGVAPHQCGQCHNNSIATGKPANHPVTNQPCDTCHRTTTWMSAAFTHLGVTPGACATCHRFNGDPQTVQSHSDKPVLRCLSYDRWHIHHFAIHSFRHARRVAPCNARPATTVPTPSGTRWANMRPTSPPRPRAIPATRVMSHSPWPFHLQLTPA